MIDKRRNKKIETEIGSVLKEVKEDNAIKEKKSYSIENLVIAINDLSLELNNPYFKAPFNRCPDCNKGNNTVLAYFGVGGSNKLGNLKGFQATIGDIVAWYGLTYKGISIVKSKNNGVFELETSPFDIARKEPAVIERMVVPSIYRPILGEMAEYLTNKDIYKGDLVKIGEGEYPNAIRKKL